MLIDGIKNKALLKFLAPPSKPAGPALKRQQKDGETRAQHGMRSALDADRLRWNKYLEARTARLNALVATHSGARKYVTLLDRLSADVVAYSCRDCDTDLSELAARLELRTIERVYDRFLLLEVTGAWLSALAKRQGVGALDDADPLPLDGQPLVTMTDLKYTLDLV